MPKPHEFSYKIFMMYLDLDELPSLFENFWLWSNGKNNIASFDRKQHMGALDISLSTSIRQFVKRKTGSYPTGPIRLLTHLKYFGYCFNPVSFYYCFNSEGETLHTIVAEVNNTPWNEQHCYALSIENENENKPVHIFKFNKEFHVSPFNGLNQQYDWRFTDPNQDINIFMSVFEKGQPHFNAMMNLEKKPINSGSMAETLLRYPFMTIKIIFSIYYQALKLYVKRVPTHTHPMKKQFARKENRT